MHEGRLAEICALVAALGARRVIDMGCGEGDLLVRLAEMGLERLVGLEIGAARLAAAGSRLKGLGLDGQSVELVEGSMLTVDARLGVFDVAVMLETIEHVAPEQLSVLERAVFLRLAPAHVIVTTPNADMNPRLGVPPGRFRHPEHKFEWGHEKFSRWADGVGARCGYGVRVEGLGGWPGVHPGATQMAVLSRT
jgi:2-polyprenyl-3-methyl-5-hydroxy-6-metoxy-1,4-benzoquinol methylase